MSLVFLVSYFFNNTFKTMKENLMLLRVFLVHILFRLLDQLFVL